MATHEERVSWKPCVWTDEGKFHLDSRGLPAVAALTAVLAALDAMGGGRTLVAHLDASIEALYPQLAKRNCKSAFVPGEPAEVRLEISTPG